jgi:hypothetical protein
VNNRKNHNSVLFLATLGVYLGLVLTGSTPLVAHAALTKPFDVRDEISYRDDLDNKPDDDRMPGTVSLQGYVEEVGTFLDALRDLHLKGAFDPRHERSTLGQAAVFPCVNGIDTHCSQFAFKLDKTDFRLDLAVKKKTAGDAVRILSDSNGIARTYFASGATSVREKIVANSDAHVENDQTIVITHLPRAGLDPLLIKNAK